MRPKYTAIIAIFAIATIIGAVTKYAYQSKTDQQPINNLNNDGAGCPPSYASSLDWAVKKQS